MVDRLNSEIQDIEPKRKQAQVRRMICKYSNKLREGESYFRVISDSGSDEQEEFKAVVSKRKRLITHEKKLPSKTARLDPVVTDISPSFPTTSRGSSGGVPTKKVNLVGRDEINAKRGYCHHALVRFPFLF